jgi:hypothetical protein
MLFRPVALLCALLPAAAIMGADPPPLALSLTMPDVARSSQAMSDGPGAAVWKEPMTVQWRAQLARQSGASPLWSDMSGRGKSLRAELRIGPDYGGLAVVEGVAGLMLPPGADPEAPLGMRVLRSNAWLLFGLDARDLSLPDRTPVESPGRRLDLGLIADLPVCAPLLGAWSRVPVALGAQTLRMVAGIEGAQVVESLEIAGGSPLRAVDTSVLAGMPVAGDVVCAIGIDGKALAAVAAAVMTAFGGDAARTDAWLQESAGTDLATLCAGLDGTVACSLRAGRSWPEVLLNLPASEALDALVAARVQSEHLDLAEQVLADARTEVVPFCSIGPFPLQMRRTATRWMFGTVAERVGQLADEEPTPFPLNRFGELTETTQAVCTWNWSGLAPMLVARVTPGDGPAWNTLAGAVRMLASRLPAGAAVVSRTDEGLHIDARNGLGTFLLAAMAVADNGVPILVRSYHQAAYTQGQVRLRHIVARAVAFSKEQKGHWPRDMEDLRAWAKDLGADAFAAAGHPEIEMPYCYVPPAQGVADDQPVLVQDPACNVDGDSLVGYADGRVVKWRGPAMWQEAVRLSQLAKTGKRGIERSEWATLPKVF